MAIQKPATALASLHEVLRALRRFRRATATKDKNGIRHPKKSMPSAGPDKCLKLSLDTHDVVFRRQHRDGQKLLVHGEVVFCTQTPTAIKSVKVALHGVRKVHWLTNTLQSQTVRQKDVIFSQDRLLYIFLKGTDQAKKVAPGRYIWPFTFTLPSSLPDSIPWLPLDTYIRYSICADITIGSGVFTRKLCTSEPLRLIKSPSFFIDELEFAPDITQQIAHITLPASELDATVTLAQPYQPTDNGGGVLETSFALTPFPTTNIPDSSSSISSNRHHRTITLSLELLQTVHLVVTDKHGEPHRGTKCIRCVAEVSRSIAGSELLTKDATVGAAARATAVEVDCAGEPRRRNVDDEKDGWGNDADSTNSAGSTTPPPPTTCFDLTLPLPMAPYALVQSVHDGDKIRVRYTLRAKVSVKDNDDDRDVKKVAQKEVSVYDEVVSIVNFHVRSGADDAAVRVQAESANLFPKLFVPVCERRDSVISNTSSACETDIVDECGVVTSLPSYGEHLFDAYFCWDARGLRADDIPRERNPVRAVPCCAT
ncbi:carbon catabolite repression protein [Diplodia corticola]|uniref:Carbon catabolite repression protein n=1 Tax=Diplodia corticola TaxID=236234 RepID=A0A1J9RL77_9PEZI|nr:carbon catabolite repression protein [Diplodia corticola]OJD28676.1 carbon catabolite repression protein [Diplodia corticola]